MTRKQVRLTPRQQEVYDALQSDNRLSYTKLAHKLGVHKTTVRHAYIAACKKMGHEPINRILGTSGNERKMAPGAARIIDTRLSRMAISKRSHEDQARAMFSAMDPMMRTIKEAAEEAGVSAPVMSKLMDIMHGELGTVNKELSEVRLDKLKGTFGRKLEKVVESISDDDIENASLKDKAIAAGILTEKWLLLRGQPTQILQVEERRRLDEIVPVLEAEARRRLIDLNRDPVTGTYSPVSERDNINSKALRRQERPDKRDREAAT